MMHAVQPAGQPDQTSSLPSVSAVIVSHNRLPELKRCIQALLASSGVPVLEIVVVDAGSRDGSADVENEFPGIRMVRMPRNFGKTRARNNGVRTATGDLILFVDPSMEVSSDTVRFLVESLEKHVEVVVAAPRVTDGAGAVIETAYRLPSPEQLAQACLDLSSFPPVPADGAAEAVCGGILLVRKSFIAGMNYFDEKRFFEYFAELDLFRQVRNAGKKVLLVPEAVAIRHEESAEPPDADSRVLAVCDKVSGAAAYLAKAGGSAMSFQIKMMLRELGASLRGTDAGFHWHVLTGLLGGRRIDGTQGGRLA